MRDLIIASPSLIVAGAAVDGPYADTPLWVSGIQTREGGAAEFHSPGVGVVSPYSEGRQGPVFCDQTAFLGGSHGSGRRGTFTGQSAMIHNSTTPQPDSFICKVKKVGENRWQAAGLMANHPSDGDTLILNNGVDEEQYTFRNVRPYHARLPVEAEIEAV
jgi:hypothetical protein